MDALVVTLVSTRSNSVRELLSATAAVLEHHPGLTKLVILVGPPCRPVGEQQVPVYGRPEEGVEALGRI